MDCSTIMAILIDKRTDAAPKVQKILTENGCIIATRLGLHESLDKCSEEGLIILTLSGSQEEIDDLKSELEEVHRVKVDLMQLSFSL
ncbi:MAG: hypothetical protein ACQERJ_08670 [Bacillota bacterium]